jgi:hypothetical protein
MGSRRVCSVWASIREREDLGWDLRKSEYLSSTFLDLLFSCYIVQLLYESDFGTLGYV